MTTDTSSASPELWTIQRILQWSTDFLKTRGSPSARLDAELLISHTLGLSRIQLYTGFDKPVTEVERVPLREFIRRRGVGEPVAYIIGQKEFMGLSFTVSPAVLIPRPDTEVLIEAVQAQYRSDNGPKPQRILDIGTGSGCIAIALANLFSEAAIEAWDISAAALNVARGNAARLDAGHIQFEQRDARALASWSSSEPFDCIVSNPPYIAHAELADLPNSVRLFEPSEALFAEADGLEFYHLIAERAPRIMTENARLFLEIGHAQASAVQALLEQSGWRQVRVQKDYGRHDRVVEALVPLSSP